MMILGALLILAGVTATQSDASDRTERELLMELYRATNGDGWSNNQGWGTNEPHCSWYGVQCNEVFTLRPSAVTSIYLRMNELRGELPESLVGLSALRGLDLGMNQLTGSVPSQLLARWDRASLDLRVDGNRFSNMVAAVRIDLRYPHLLCGPQVNWSATLSDRGRIRYESVECAVPGDPQSRKTVCVVREADAPSLDRLSRALDRLGFRDLEAIYKDEIFLSTHAGSLSTEVTFGDGSTKGVTTSGTSEPLEVWMAQALLLNSTRAEWDAERREKQCALIR
jgi:hypothetical protein